MTYVIISGGIDLSVGSGVAFFGVFSAIMVTRHLGFVPAIIFDAQPTLRSHKLEDLRTAETNRDEVALIMINGRPISRPSSN